MHSIPPELWAFLRDLARELLIDLGKYLVKALVSWVMGKWRARNVR